MKRGAITIKDIARALKISPSTVSRALKGHPDISQKTKDAVADLATRLNYQPNLLARNLRKSESNTIGVITPRIAHQFFSNIISGLEEVAHGRGYNIVICQSNDSFHREAKSVSALLSSMVEGMCVSLASETQTFDHLRQLSEAGISLILFDRVHPDIEAHKVVVNDREGASMVVQYLIETGCRRIAHLAGPDSLMISKERCKGYHEALARHGLEPLIIPAGMNHENGYEATHELLNSGQQVDGIFAVSDPTAMGAIKAIRHRGIRVPDQISVVGFSDDPLAAFITPSLTTVVQPSFEMGKATAELFFDSLQDPEMPPRTVILPTRLVVRESTLPQPSHIGKS